MATTTEAAKRKKWAKMTKHQRRAAKRSGMFAKAKANKAQGKDEKLSVFSKKTGPKDSVTGKKTTALTQVTDKDTKLTAGMKRGGALGWINRKRKRLGDKLKVATSAFKKG